MSYSELFDTDGGYDVITWASEAAYQADTDNSKAIDRRPACLCCVIANILAEPEDIPTGTNTAYWHDETGYSDGNPVRVCDDCLAASSPTGPGYRRTYNAPRFCHACGRLIDPHAPARVVDCGRCGDV